MAGIQADQFDVLHSIQQKRSQNVPPLGNAIEAPTYTVQSFLRWGGLYPGPAGGVNDVNVLDRFRLDGKIALVTGCRRGLGQAMALALAEAGAGIIGVSRSLAAGSDVERAVLALGRRFQGYACDFSDRPAVYAFLERVRAGFPVIDILVNNAGIILRRPAAEHPDEDWDQVIETNLTAQFILAREIGQRMVERGSGKIIFTASVLSFQGGVLVPGYAASKGAIAQLTKALANEWAARGVQVNAIAPGYMTTDNTTALRNDPARAPAILARIPAGRWGVPEDLQGAVVFLASAASDYVHGAILPVDGGWLAR
jgi:2-deoxy-D-gluconate 3-dehydrogenase